MRVPENQPSDKTRVQHPQDEWRREPTIEFWNAPTLPTQATIAAMLERITASVRQGERRRAYLLSHEVTILAPYSVEAWLYHAALTDSDEERLNSLNKALSLAPEHLNARRSLYKALKLYLNQDPFLRYLEETDFLYHVLTGQGRVVIVPKDRASASPYPPVAPSPLQSVFRWLRYSVLGLPLAGLLTLVCAPVAAVLAWRASRQRLGITDRRRAMMALLYAAVLWMVGALLTVLFLVHLL